MLLQHFMQVQGASPPASDDEDEHVGTSTGSTSDAPSATAASLHPEHTQRQALGQQPSHLVRKVLHKTHRTLLLFPGCMKGVHFLVLGSRRLSLSMPPKAKEIQDVHE